MLSSMNLMIIARRFGGLPALSPAGRHEGSETMDEKGLKFFEELLQSRLDALLSEAQETFTDLSEGEENFADPTDRATAESDRNFLLRIRDRERKLIVKIQEALARVADKTYGDCEGCGEEIGRKRLEARPVTTQCIDCKTEAEQREKTGS